MDPILMKSIAVEFVRRFASTNINKVMTIEASGIAPAIMVGYLLELPVVFAKKTLGKNIAADVYSTPIKSFTHGKTYDVIVSQEFLNKEDKILIIDDFLANGEALRGLCEIVSSAGAELVGMGVAVEKGFQPGGKKLRDAGIPLYSLAIIEKADGNGIVFRDGQEEK